MNFRNTLCAMRLETIWIALKALSCSKSKSLKKIRIYEDLDQGEDAIVIERRRHSWGLLGGLTNEIREILRHIQDFSLCINVTLKAIRKDYERDEIGPGILHTEGNNDKIILHDADIEFAQ
jgi:hypothetical protein